MDYFYTANLSISASPEYPAIPAETQYQEWEYCMRREMQEILPNVFLGPYAAATKSKHMQLCQFGISHIICIRHQTEANYVKPNFPDQFRYMVLNINDVQTENIIRFFPEMASVNKALETKTIKDKQKKAMGMLRKKEVKEFIDVCLSGNGKCLVHGNAGISRSAALVIAYIMETYGLAYRKAFKIVQQKRFCINPNEGFQQQLVEYEPICKARAQQAITDIANQQPHDTGVKRRHDDDEDDANTAHSSKSGPNKMMTTEPS